MTHAPMLPRAEYSVELVVRPLAVKGRNLKPRQFLNFAPACRFARRANHSPIFENRCPSPFAKIFRLTRRANQRHSFARLTRERGGSRSSRTLRWDAVDADGAKDERAIRGRRSRVVLTPRCWRQVREGQLSLMTVATKPVTGESSKKAVKTIARGMPGDFRCDLTNACASLTIMAHAAIGRIGRPAFPAPSLWRRREFLEKLARNARRDRETVSCE